MSSEDGIILEVQKDSSIIGYYFQNEHKEEILKTDSILQALKWSEDYVKRRNEEFDGSFELEYGIKVKSI